MSTGPNLTDSIKKAAKIHNLISTAYHESGHVIYGILHMMRIESAWIMEKAGAVSGNTDYIALIFDQYNIDNDLKSFMVSSEIGMCYAGQLAEKIYYRKTSGVDKLPMFLQEGSSLDTSEAARLIKKFRAATPGRARYEYKKKLLKIIEKEIEENWSDVELISHYLFSKKKISTIKLIELLENNSVNSKFWKKRFKILLNIYKNFDSLDEKEIKIIFKQSGLI